MPSTLSNVTNVFTLFSFSTALWSTVSLFILIEKKSPKEFGGYKNFMRIYCYYAFIFALTDWISQPSILIDIRGFGYVFYAENRLFDIGYTAGFVVQILYCGCFLASSSFLSLNFLYRYVSTVKSPFIIYFQGWRVVSVILYCAVPFSVWSFLVYTLMGPRPERTAHLKVTTMLIEHLDLSGKPYVGVLCRHVSNSTGHEYGDIEWGTMGTLLGLFGFQGFFYTVSLFCGVLTYRHTMALFNMAKISKKLYEMQVQLLRAIVIQASVPLVLVYIPPSIMIIGGMFGVYVGQIGYLVVMSISMYPPLDSLVFLLSIGAYRSALFCQSNGSIEGQSGNKVANANVSVLANVKV